jgi:hypothetical protein
VAVSRIAFALGDLRSELTDLIPEELHDPPLAEVCMAVPIYEAVVRELEYHHGAKLQKEPGYRGTAVRYAGLRLIMTPPGNR